MCEFSSRSHGVPDYAEHIPAVAVQGLLVLAILLLTAGKDWRQRSPSSSSSAF